MMIGVVFPMQAAPVPDDAVFLNFLPHSGNSYTRDVLCKFLKLSVNKVSQNTFPEDSIYEPAFLRFLESKDKWMLATFVSPNPNNIDILHRHLNKIVLHVRDPREALIAYIRYTDKHPTHTYLLSLIYPPPPPEYFDWTFEKKADWQIEHFFKYSIQWLNQWLDRIEMDANLTVLPVTFEDMIQDPLSYFQEIVSFYGIDPQEFKQSDLIAPMGLPQYPFTKGDIATWRTRLTDAQKQYITSLMDERLLSAFNWDE